MDVSDFSIGHVFPPEVFCCESATAFQEELGSIPRFNRQD
jgi:hypothetical protein